MVLFSLPVVVYFWLIHRYSVNAIWYDQWWDVRLLGHLYSGSLHLGDLWAQHGENRIFFPNLVMLLIAQTTHLNLVTESYLGACLLVLGIGLLIGAHRSRSRSTAWIWYWPFAVLLLSFVQYQDSLWGFQMAWYLVFVSLAATIFLLDRPVLGLPLLAAAMVVAVVGSFSSLQGLLIWPVGLLLLYQRRRPRASIITWVVVAAGTAALYFHHLDTTTAGGNGSYAFAHPLAEVRYFFVAISGVYASRTSAGAGGQDDLLIGVGVVIFVVAVGTLVTYGRRPNETGGSPIGVALILYGLLFAAIMTVGRADGGLVVASTSRYATFDLLIPAGCYLALLDPTRVRARGSEGRDPDPGRARRSWVVRLVMVAAIGVLVVHGTWGGIKQAEDWHRLQVVSADITVRMDSAPAGVIDSYLLPGCGCRSFSEQLPRLAEVARVHRLSLFGTGAVGDYLRTGLPRDVVPPVVEIRLPAPGSVLRGAHFISASASDLYGVTKVEFVLLSPSGPDQVVAEGTRYEYGWLGGWHTNTVADGTYRLQAVASDAAGNVGRSGSVPVRVAN